MTQRTRYEQKLSDKRRQRQRAREWAFAYLTNRYGRNLAEWPKDADEMLADLNIESLELPTNEDPPCSS